MCYFSRGFFRSRKPEILETLNSTLFRKIARFLSADSGRFLLVPSQVSPAAAGPWEVAKPSEFPLTIYYTAHGGLPKI